MPHGAEGEQVAKSFTKLWRLENRFTQMQIEISLSWDFLLLSAARGREMGEARIHTIWNYTCFTAWIILVWNKQHQLTHSFHVIPFFPTSGRAIRSTFRSYSSSHKATEGWKQLPGTLRCNSFNHHSARTQTNWEASLLCPRLTFLLAFYFPAICTSQSHRFVQSLAVKLVTFLGGSCKGGEHVRRPKCPGEDTPTQCISGILLFPALPGICLPYQDAESGHGSAPPSFCQHRAA